VQMTTSRSRRSWLGLLPGLLLIACSAEEEPEAAALAGTPVRAPLSIVEPGLADMLLDAVGTVEPLAQATPATRVSGRITRIAADRGDRVEAGQLLVRVDSRDLQQGLERARAQAAQAEAAYRLAQADYDRAESLFNEDAIAQQGLDRARMARDGARAALDAADRSVGQSQAHLTYGDVRAPFAGLVTDRRVEIGDLAAPGQPLVTIERTDSVKVKVIVAESSIQGIKAGDSAIIDAADQHFAGIVESIVPTASPLSRSYEVRIVIDNRQGLLRTGQFARAGFKVGERRSLFIDNDLIVQQGQLRGVYVLTQGRALLRWLRLGVTQGNDVEVLSGLSAGERIVEPVAGVHDGVAITVTQGA
jgi:RND family efflux transporter MFP subunit